MRNQSQPSLFAQSLEEFQDIFWNAPVGIYKSTPEGRFLAANPAWAQMCGYESPQDLIESVLDIATQIYCDPRDREAFKHLLNMQCEVVDYEYRLRRTDGRVLWVAENVRAVWDEEGEITYYQGFATDISKRKQAEAAVKESEQRFAKAFRSSPAPQVISDIRTGKFIDVNDSWMEMVGYSKDEMIGRTSKQVGIWKDPHVRDKLVYKLQMHGHFKEESIVFRTKHGDVIEALWSAEKITFQGHEMMLSMFYDQTERKQAEETLRQKNKEQAVLLDFIPTQLWYLCDVETYGAVNQAHADFLGFPKNEIEFQCLDHFLSPEEAEICKKGNVKVYASKKQIHSEEWLYNALGEQRLLAITKTPKLDDDGNVEYLVCSGMDITEQRQYESELKYLSLHDQLTGLFNRAYLENELERLGKSRDYPITILCMDLDGLKLVNDTLGHDHGDNQLRVCANILRDCFRASDIIARAGGDEFVVLLPSTDIEAGRLAVQRVRSRVESHNQDHKEQIPLSLSIGIACADEHEKDLVDIFKQADDLMYRDKLHRDVNSRSQIMKALMAALEERDFITSGHAHRLEALCSQLGRKVNLSSPQLSNLNLLAQVHDLGKVGIPDSILFKPGSLTGKEWEIMRQHPEKGYRIAQATTDLAGIADLILMHHERWDGHGYPLGLAGEEIPIECRILAIADSFDAMTNDRPYRKAMPVEEALAELEKCSGTQFDPQLVAAFLEIMSGDLPRGKE
jgi:diguanylate cyclase (GGDEF)-like protein/PAS domain S-box-containing protein